MDSVHSSETQSTQITCRNTASNTNPITCGCCGSKDYVQTVPQANSIRAFYPGAPKCGHSNKYEEDFTIQQPLFTSPPFLPNFFHNFALSPNPRCSHINSSDAICLQHNEAILEMEKFLRQSSLFGGFLFPQKEKTECNVNKTPTDPDVLKNTAFSDNECSLNNSKKGQDTTNSQQSSCIQKCMCRNFPPWICSPFIMPLISYCVLWNSQRPHFSFSPSNYSCNHEENLPKGKHEGDGNPDLINSESENKADLIAANTSQESNNTSNSVEVEDSNTSTENKLTKTDWRTHRQRNGSTSSFISTSTNYPEDNNLESEVKKEERILFLKNSSEESSAEEADDMEAEDDDSTEKVENYEGTLSERNLTGSEISLENNENQLLSSSETAFELREENSETNEQSDTQLDPAETPLPDLPVVEQVSWEKLPEEPVQNMSDGKPTDSTPLKKLYKNFTMTGETSMELQQNSTAAAGDLGGDTCAGYRITISSLEEDSKPNLQDTQTESNSEEQNNQAILKENNEPSFQNKTEISPEKSSDLKTKLTRANKSGIAKPLGSYKAKEDASRTKTLKNNEPQQKEPHILKRKHSCFPKGVLTETHETTSKIQKKTTSAANKQPVTGSEKFSRSKTTDSKINPVKKVTKTSTERLRRPTSKQMMKKGV